jgi:hypothetical protein
MSDDSPVLSSGLEIAMMLSTMYLGLLDEEYHDRATDCSQEAAVVDFVNGLVDTNDKDHLKALVLAQAALTALLCVQTASGMHRYSKGEIEMDPWAVLSALGLTSMKYAEKAKENE